jgi:hypothetical protein
MIQSFNWAWQLSVLVAIWWSLALLKKSVNFNFLKKIKIVDISSIYLLFCIQLQSQAVLQASFLPYILFAAAILGLALTLLLAVAAGEISRNIFWTLYWRTLELLILMFYLFLLVLTFIKK